MSALSQRAPSPDVASYDFDPAFFDEAFAEPGVPRTHYSEALGALSGVQLDELRRSVAQGIEARGVRFRSSDGDKPFVVDPVPRILCRAEWETLEEGLSQRVRALDAFLLDVYGDRAIVEAGRLPARVLDGAEHYEPDMVGVDVSARPGVVGLDVVRDADGRFLVLEDNARTPSGMLYAEAALDAVEESIDLGLDHRPSAFRWTMLAEALRVAAPGGVEEPSIVLLSDGPDNSAWWEHETIARRLGIPLVTMADLEPRGERLHARVEGRTRAVDVLYRRTDQDRLRDAHGHPTELAAALLAPIRAGRLACVNAFGAGVADDKLVHAYTEEMIRFYLGEEPLVPSVPTYDLADPDALEQCLDRLGDLVLKPRVGHGGEGVVVGAHADAEDLAEVRRRIEAEPERFVAQETVAISRHPTVCGGRLAPRHVDLRPFVLSTDGRTAAVPGGLTRVAFTEGSLVVNSSQAGGAKATWVLE